MYSYFVYTYDHLGNVHNTYCFRLLGEAVQCWIHRSVCSYGADVRKQLLDGTFQTLCFTGSVNRKG